MLELAIAVQRGEMLPQIFNQGVVALLPKLMNQYWRPVSSDRLRCSTLITKLLRECWLHASSATWEAWYMRHKQDLYLGDK